MMGHRQTKFPLMVNTVHIRLATLNMKCILLQILVLPNLAVQQAEQTHKRVQQLPLIHQNPDK